MTVCWSVKCIGVLSPCRKCVDSMLCSSLLNVCLCTCVCSVLFVCVHVCVCVCVCVCGYVRLIGV